MQHLSDICSVETLLYERGLHTLCLVIILLGSSEWCIFCHSWLYTCSLYFATCTAKAVLISASSPSFIGHHDSWRTAALSFMKFCLSIYLDNLCKPIEYEGHGSKVTWFLCVWYCLNQLAWVHEMLRAVLEQGLTFLFVYVINGLCKKTSEQIPMTFCEVVGIGHGSFGPSRSISWLRSCQNCRLVIGQCIALSSIFWSWHTQRTFENVESRRIVAFIKDINFYHCI